jgi:hypothetical protein
MIDKLLWASLKVLLVLLVIEIIFVIMFFIV